MPLKLFKVHNKARSIRERKGEFVPTLCFRLGQFFLQSMLSDMEEA